MTDRGRDFAMKAEVRIGERVMSAVVIDFIAARRRSSLATTLECETLKTRIKTATTTRQLYDLHLPIGRMKSRNPEAFALLLDLLIERGDEIESARCLKT
jgi:hypothetical protein